MTDTLQEEDFDLLMLDEPELECQSKVLHTCTHVARWAVTTPTPALCSAVPGMDHVILWCDGRHRLYLADLEIGRLCLCFRPITHWRVTRL